MKKFLLITGAILMMMACTKEEVCVPVNESSENSTVQTVEVNVEPFGNADTKTAVSVTNDVATYSWSAGDEIGIYPYANSALSGQTSQQITFKLNGSGASTSATFTGTGWGLVTNGDYGYFSYYPYSSTAKYNEVAVSFSSSLNQTSNDDTGHLTGLDRLYAPKIQPESGTEASFTFKHLTALVEFEITVPDSVKNRAFKTMTVTAPSKLFTTAGTYDPSSATDSIVPAITPTATTDKLIVSLNGSTGIVPDSDSTFHLFFLMAPAAVGGKTLSIKLIDVNDNIFVASKSLTSDIASNDYNIYVCSVVLKPLDAENLSACGTANCYIVPESGKYMFLANVKGNGVVPTGMTESPYLNVTGCTAEVIWETENTDAAPAVGAIVSNAELIGDYIFFDAKGNQGNALIALKNGGNIVWSWHIWSTNADLADSTHTYGGANMMDRNLGALSATPGDALTFGLHYQWGRPSPITGGCTFTGDNARMATTGDDDLWIEEETSAARGTLAYSAENPTHFLYCSENNYFKGTTNKSYNWLWTANDYPKASSLPRFWDSVKTMYDPCPVGWKVPAGGSNGVWDIAGFDYESFPWNATYKGRVFESPKAYYPAAGRRRYDNGVLTSVGSVGFCWSSSVNGDNGCDLYFDATYLAHIFSNQRAYGFPIRPCQE